MHMYMHMLLLWKEEMCAPALKLIKPLHSQ